MTDPKRLPAPRADGMSLARLPGKESCDACGRTATVAELSRAAGSRVFAMCEECRLMLFHLLGRFDRPDFRTE